MNDIQKSAECLDCEARQLAETEALKRLNVASSRLWRTTSLRDGLEEMLAATIELLGADMGNVQILDAASGNLTIAAQRGFDAEFLDFFREVSVEDGSACGQALRARERIVIEDVEQDILFAPYVQIARNADFRAVQSTPLVDRNSRPLGMLSTHFRFPHYPSELDLQRLDLYARQASDFIERCRREDELRERAEEREALLDALPAFIWFGDAQNRVIRGNRAANQMTGVATGANVSQSAIAAGATYLFQLKRDGTEYSPEELPVQRAIATLRPVHDAYIDFRFPDGRRVETIGNAAPLFDANGAVRGGVGAFIDVSERNRAERALREADRRKDEFLATLAHELRNPLAPIANAVYLLQKAQRDGNANGDRARAALTMAEHQIQHLVRLVDDLLEVSRITTGKIEIRKERIDLAVVLRESLETSRPLIAEAGHETTVALGGEALAVNGDPVRLAQVFTNLFNNAAKYTPSGGRIDVSMERAGATGVVRVRDTGLGIPADMLSRIFELFTQVDRSLGRAHGGIGVGLALARRLLELHGGDIEARSDGLGKGSEFVVRLPLTAAPDRVSHLGDGRDLLGYAVRRVLVVDDEPTVADSLVMLLDTLGVDARVVYGGDEALLIIGDFKPDLAFIDIGMPRMDGYETPRQIRKLPEGKDLVLAALSGWGRAEDRRKGIDAGFDHHFVKPIGLAVLERVLAAPHENKMP